MTVPEVNTVASPGGGLAGKIAKTVADASVYSKQRLSDHTVKLGVMAFTEATNHVSDEVRSVMGPLFQAIAEHPDTPSELRPLARQLATGRGQAWAWIGGTATGAALGGGLLNLLTNELNPAILPIIAANPHGILSPSDAASAYARHLISQQFSRDDAAKGGMNGDRWQALTGLATARPTVADTLDLLRRGQLTHAEAETRILHLGFTQEDTNALLSLRYVPPSPEQLAAMWNRNIVTSQEGAQLAQASGVSTDDFHKLMELGGEPLGPQDLGEAYRRGFIDKARFNRGIVQGPIRNEWFDTLEKLQYHRMSPIDASDAVNQGHMSQSAGEEVAVANGLDANDFQTLLLTAGAPPGIDFATEALNRGMITLAQFREMFLESRIKNKYLGLLEEMRIRLIPQETVRLLYRNGVYSEADALQTLLQHGFSAKDAAALLALEKTRADDSTKDLTRAQVADMYEERMITLGEAVGALTGLGYSDDDAHSIVELADLSRLRRFITSATNRVKAAYVSGRINETGANSALDRIGIRPDQKDDLFALWDIEATTVSKTLTSAQVRQAFKKGFIDETDAMNRLTAQGYDIDDAGLYLRLTS